MKIAFITEHVNPGFGGAETYMNDFSQFLIRQGHEVHFYTQDVHPDQQDLFFHLIKASGIATKIRWWQWLTFLKMARTYLLLSSTFDELGLTCFLYQYALLLRAHQK